MPEVVVGVIGRALDALTFQSPGFGTAATVRVEIGEGDNQRATSWTSRAEIESRNGRLHLRFADDERWRLDPSDDQLRLTVMASRREGLEGESLVLGLWRIDGRDATSAAK